MTTVVTTLPPPTVPFTVNIGGQQYINDEWYLAFNTLFGTLAVGPSTGDIVGSWPHAQVVATQGTPFSPSATLDTTNGSNITKGTLSVANGVNFGQLGMPLNGNLVNCIGPNLSGVISSIGNATTTTLQTGSGSTFVMQGNPIINSPTLVGVSDSSSAAPGNVGEYISSRINAASAVSVLNSTNTVVTTINLTAGDWDVGGNAIIVNTGNTTQQAAYVWQNVTAPDVSYDVGSGGPSITAPFSGFTCPTLRSSSSSPLTPWSLVVNSIFSTGACTAYGFIWARRIR